MNEFLTDSSVWGVLVTIGAYGIGTVIQKKTKAAWCNPLLMGSILVIVMLSVLKVPYAEYKSSASPLTYLLLPATVSLAIPLYEQWELLKKNLAAILAGITAGVMTSIVSIAAICVLFNLQREEMVSLLPKSVTTAIGVDIATELGGIPALTTSVIILTGIIGNLIAVGACRLFRITDPVARGIAIGTSSHAIGTARALEMGEVEGAMSSLSIAVAGVMTAVLCPIAASFI